MKAPFHAPHIVQSFEITQLVVLLSNKHSSLSPEKETYVHKNVL
jgi:hypothetical protein